MGLARPLRLSPSQISHGEAADNHGHASHGDTHIPSPRGSKSNEDRTRASDFLLLVDSARQILLMLEAGKFFRGQAGDRSRQNGRRGSLPTHSASQYLVGLRQVVPLQGHRALNEPARSTALLIVSPDHLTAASMVCRQAANVPNREWEIEDRPAVGSVNECPDFREARSETTIRRFDTGAFAQKPIEAAFLACFAHPCCRSSHEKHCRGSASHVASNRAGHAVSISRIAKGQGERQGNRTCKR